MKNSILIKSKTDTMNKTAVMLLRAMMAMSLRQGMQMCHPQLLPIHASVGKHEATAQL